MTKLAIGPVMVTSPHPLHGYTTSSWSRGDSGKVAGESSRTDMVIQRASKASLTALSMRSRAEGRGGAEG